jgi:ParB family transcriptional regulator, chromosome partitioning protein
MKRDLLFVVESLLPLLDERRLSAVARNRGIRPREGEALGKVLSAWLRKADEGELGRLLVEAAILLSARSGVDAGKVLRAAAETYKVDTDALALKVKQESAAKEKARKTAKPDAKATAKPKRAA